VDSLPGLSHQASLLVYLAIAVGALVALIGPGKINAFVALTLVSLFVGICAGMSLTEVGTKFQDGVGTMLASVAIVVGLGVMLGKLLAESGGAEIIARRLNDFFGPHHADWTMLIVAWIVGLPVFFTVGLVLLAPLAFSLAKQSQLPWARIAIPMLAGLSVAHGLVPPHPGPMAAVAALGADPGKTILYSIALGFPIAVLAGPLFAQWIAPRLPDDFRPPVLPEPNQTGRLLPGFFSSSLTMLCPVLLMLASTVATMQLPPESGLLHVIQFLGHPAVAMLAAVLLAFYTFGYRLGLSRTELLKRTEESLGPAALILLVVGAGGGFNRILIESGVGSAISELAQRARVSPLLLGWLLAAAIRVATGSATVAITTAAGLVAPLAAAQPGTRPELLVCAMGAGSLILSHLNDGGFWFVKEYLRMSVGQTLQIWTVMETVVAVAGLLLVLLFQAFF